MTTIIVTHEDNEVDEFEFDSGHELITIGRRSDNDVAIPNLSISGKHAKVCLEDGVAFLEDLNSTNGTYVNGELVKRKAVDSGDDIILGKIRLGVILPNVEGADVAPGDLDQDTKRKLDDNDVAEALDDSSNFSADKMGGSPDPLDADEMSFEEDVKLFNQSASNSSQDDSVVADVANLDSKEIDSVQASSKLSDLAKPAVAAAALTRLNAGDSDDADAWVEPEDSLHNGASAIDQDADERDDIDEESAVVASFDSNAQPHPLDGLDAKSLPDDDAPPMHELDSASSTSKGAVIEIKNGAKSGQILPIDKPVTTLGRPGIQIAAIMRKPDGYFLMHIESDDSVDRPTLNQDAIGDEPVLLHSGDELNVAGIDVEFMLS